MSRWTRNEVLLALNLYLETPFGKQHSRHSPIVELANMIGRTPSAVAMKLNNLTSLDPAERARGVQGLGNASRLDSEIWEEFRSNPGTVAVEIESLITSPTQHGQHSAKSKATEKTEAIAETRVRLQQGFFRRIIMGTYESKCCVTGNPISELLRASHIVPWSESIEQRLNPRNGLCLVATFDVAFDRGLIWFDQEFRLRVGKTIYGFSNEREIEEVFLKREGDELRLPEKNLPDPELIGWHRDNIAQLN